MRISNALLRLLTTAFHDGLQLKELAAVSGYSLSRFKIKFREVVGFPSIQLYHL